MARKLLSTMDLPISTASAFANCSLFSAKDVLCTPESDLLELVDIPWPELSAGLEKIHECVCPPHRTVLSLWKERNALEIGGGHFATKLPELDDALQGGLPFGLITELVGAAGVGKTQFCLMLSVLAAIPVESGGLGGRVIYIDTEHKFTSRRMIEIAQGQFPHMFDTAETMQQLAEQVLVLRPVSVSDLTKILQGLEIMITEYSVRLVIIDSVAALLESEEEDLLDQTQNTVGEQASLLKFLAETFRIPVVVTNQVRSTSTHLDDDPGSTSPQAVACDSDDKESSDDDEPMELGMEDGLTAALGIKWAHSVNIRLLLEAPTSGHRLLKIVKSPLSPCATFPFQVTSKGLELQITGQS